MRWPNILMAVSGFSALGMSFAPHTAKVTADADPQPIFKAHCVSCHGGDKPAAGLDLTKSLADIGSSWVIAKGDATGSLLMKRVSGKFGKLMPPGGPPLSDDDMATLSAWIKSLKADPTAIFTAKCIKCHMGAHPAGQLDLTESLATLGASKEVVAGDADNSNLYKRITMSPGRMPAGGPPLSDQEVKTVKDWIDGLNDPTPILNARCMPCHRGANARGGLNLAKTPAELANLTEVTKGDPDNSVLIQRITGAAKPQMPPGGPPLPDSEVTLLKNWIRGLKTQ